ncbi:MAG: adenylate/guanylate cyclase domain-containing protein, partial [Chloroflexia bacterium]
MPELPSGTVTFLFTDIEGSTSRWEQHPEQMRAALARHDDLLRSAIEEQGGYIFKTMGDAFCAAFSSPHAALSAALASQRALQGEQWPEHIGAIKVRMALHTGAVEEQAGDYFGQPLNRVARLLSAGHGGQTLLSLATQELVRDQLPLNLWLQDLGEHRLKDLIRPERVFQLVAPGLPSNFPPLRTLDNRPNNLSVQPTPLIGREKELAAIEKMLRREDVRLVTLT